LNVGDRESAFAKVNLCLWLGATRADGRHELVTLFESVRLADELVITASPSGQDEVVCGAVSGPNLVTDALAGLRAAGWSAPPVQVKIEKRIPVAAGMGGGSADAAAMLRCAPRLGPVPWPALMAIAASLGADVPSQLDPGPSLGTGAGEIVAPTAGLPDHGLLVLPQSFGLSTAEVYHEADRLGLARSSGELASLRGQLEAGLAPAGPKRVRPRPARLAERLVVNDLQPAALSLRPEVSVSLELACDAGADQALVCGSGPTVIGIFWGSDGSRRAGQACQQLRRRLPRVAAVDVVVRGVCAPTPNETPGSRNLHGR
jgi:4-diphosphocytidyl-2-C-methyl-D-erythritol kinase